MKIYGVTFKDRGKIYNFKSEFECPINVTVIVETERGLQFAKVVKEITNYSKSEDSLKEIIRISTKEDYKKYMDNLKDAEKALKKANDIIKELNLDMNLLDATYTFDKKQLLFNFYADERVDFRELAKRLAALYKTRIELRQIGARDKAEQIGGIGVCGRKLCCNSLGCQKESVTMNMAKNQNIALNPSKINGLCGRLLCCLAYEDETYSCCRDILPDVGSTVKTEFGKGKVKSLDVLKLQYDVDIDGNIHTITVAKKDESN